MAQTIVLVDDSSVDRSIYQRFLAQDDRQTYQIIEFESGEAALAWCHNHRADVILLDYSLPEMDGLEFLRLLHQQSPEDIPPVILLTGMGNVAIAVEALKLGAQDYLDKGQVTKESLLQLVRSVSQQVQLKRKLLRQQTQQQIVSEIALQMQQFLDPQQTLDVATQKIRQFLQADRVLIYQFASDWTGSIIAEAVGSEWPSAIDQQIQDTCFQQGGGLRYRQGHIWVMADIDQAELTDCHRALLEQFAVKANLVVPILRRMPTSTGARPIPSLWGLLIAHHCSGPHDWQADELSLLEQVAVQLSGAIQQAAFYQQSQKELAERQQAEQALYASEERLRLLIRYSPVSLAMFDREMCYIMASQRWVEDFDRLGRTIEDYLGHSHYEIFPDIPERWRQAHQRGLAGAIEKCEEDLFFRLEGQPQWLRWEIRPWYTADAEIGGIVIFVEEITGRKQAELKLAESESRLRLAQTASQSGVWDWDLLTHQLVWTPEYYQLYRLDPNIKPDYETWLNCIHPDDREQVNQKTLQVIDSSQAEVRVEFRVMQDDRMRWFAGIGQVLQDQTGLAVRMIGMTIDITELKQAQESLQQSNEQLQVLNQDLERANHAKDAFLRMMNHELRTPLNPILGMAEGLEEEVFGPLNDRQKRAVSKIVDRGQHLLGLVNNILDLVNLEASKISLNRYSVQVSELCRASLAAIAPQAAAKTIQLQTDISPEVGVIQVDGGRIQQVLIQLLENAVKFTPAEGTVSLQVRECPVNSSLLSKTVVQFVIKDTGIGIAPENLQRLFQFFSQLDDRLNRDYDGIGIGLALSQRLVELHKGHLTVESQVGQGSCFTVSIPA